MLSIAMDRLWRGPVARDSIIVTHESLQSTRVLKAAHVTSGAETQNSGAHRIKLKSPDWKSSCLKQKPTQSWKLPLSSCEPNDLVPLLTEQPEVLDGLWTLGIRSGDEQQGGDFKTPVFMANILVFLLDLKTTMAFEELSLGLFKFAECKDDAWIGQQANSGLTKPVEPFHTENASVWNTAQSSGAGHLKHLESISLSCLHWEQDKLTQSQLLVMQSAIIHLAITSWIALTGPQLKASLPLEDLCIFFWGVHCNVNFGMVEFAALTVWLHWMRCHNISGLHSAANIDLWRDGTRIGSGTLGTKGWTARQGWS